MTFQTRVLALLAACLLAGCASKPLPLNYAPGSVLSAEGRAQVDAFEYLPATKGEVKPNQIRNTAIGSILFEKQIDGIVRDAVFAELRFVGVKVGPEGNVLSGQIEEFLIDDLGFSVDWTLRICYLVRDAEGNVLYDQVKDTQRNTNKFANVFAALNETIKLNIEELIKDRGFVQSIN